MTNHIAHAILRLKSVQARTGLSRSSIYQRISDGSFPAPIKLGARSVGWVESDINNFIGDRIAQSRGQKKAEA